MEMREGSRTPWGSAQQVTFITEGIWEVMTAGHGGFKLDRTRNAQVAAPWRREDGWYEEDVEWAIVAFTFPQCFEGKRSADVVSTLKDYLPAAYTEVTGLPVSLAESSELRVRAAQITLPATPPITNITDEHTALLTELLAAVENEEDARVALVSCFLDGKPTSALAVVYRDGEGFIVRPLFVVPADGAVLTDHDGREANENGGGPLLRKEQGA